MSKMNDLSLRRDPDSPGWKEPMTSRDAAAAIAPTLSRRQAEVLGVFADGDFTPDEVAARLNRSVLAVRPRVSELGNMTPPPIERTGATRKNESNFPAAVWRRTAR
jgi:hypothetical protein